MAGTVASVTDFSVAYDSGSISGLVTKYMPVQRSFGTLSTNEADVQQKQVRNGVTSKLRILVLSNTPGQGVTNRVILRIDGADTNLALTFLDSISTATLVEETTIRVPFSAGQKLAFRVVVGTSGSLRIGSILMQVEDTLA